MAEQTIEIADQKTSEEIKTIVTEVNENVKKIESDLSGASGVGIAPDNMRTLSVSAGDAKISIKFTAPDDTKIQNPESGIAQTICSVKGVRILYKQGTDSILNESDGIFVADIEGEELENYRNSSYLIENLENGSYYTVAVMPYSDYGVFNRNLANQKTVQPSELQIFGFVQDFTNLDPEGTITYSDDNETFEPFTLNSDGSMNLGSWGEFPLLVENLPYMVHKDGTADYQLDPNDYTKKIDGTASDISNTSYSGGAFSWIKKVYMKETYASDGNSRHVQFAFSNKDPRTEDFKPIGFVNNGAELEGVWLPMFYMAESGQTISGTQPIYGKTTEEERTILRNYSQNAVHLGGGLMNVLRDLMYMFGRSTDTQTHFGQGCMNGYDSSASPTYGVKKNAVVSGGQFYGTTGGKELNKAFHSIVIQSFQQYLRDTQTLLSTGKLLVSKDYSVYSLTGAGYTDTGETFATTSGYPSKLRYVEGFGSTPDSDNGGSTSTGLCDYAGFNATDVRVARRLGSCNRGLNDGAGYINLNGDASNAGWDCGVGELLIPSVDYAPA